MTRKTNHLQAGDRVMRESLYEIPPGCICMGDGLMGMKCEAKEHARLKTLVPKSNVQTEGKYTRGPLEICDPGDYSDYDGDCIVVCGDDRRIAVFLGSGDEARANARLFAAASRLLNALRWSVNHSGECLGDHPELLDVAKTLLVEAVQS